MTVNKHKPHVYVIPEDRRDAQIANGFANHSSIVAQRQIDVVAEAGGWPKVLDTFKEEYLPLLRHNEFMHVVMLIDFDGKHEERRAKFNDEIPDDVRERVFVIGPFGTPESLRQSLGKGYEDIGRSLADDCDGDRRDTWDHELLQHNEVDRIRLLQTVRSFLFI